MTVQELASLQRNEVDYDISFKKKIAKYLLGAPRGSGQTLAQSLDVTERTLRNWKRSYLQESMRPRGRKKTAITLVTLLRVARDWKKQGHPGSRPVIQSLENIPTRIVREVVAQLKARRNKRYRVHRSQTRISVRVERSGIILAMDGASPEKGDHIVSRDRGDLSVNAVKFESHLTSNNTLSVLNNLKVSNQLPLVICTDNGSPFCAGNVAQFLMENKIIHLKSLPHTPEHNGSCENAVREFRELLEIHGLSTDQACRRLNDRKRKTLNWKTAAEARENFEPIDTKTRNYFYEAATSAINAAVIGTEHVYEKRKAEREAIFQILEDFELITRTRGCLPGTAKTERIA